MFYKIDEKTKKVVRACTNPRAEDRSQYIESPLSITQLDLLVYRNGKIQVNEERRKALKEEQQREARIKELKHLLTELSNDFIQVVAGEHIDDLESRRAKFRKYHAELRELMGLEARPLESAVEA